MSKRLPPLDVHAHIDPDIPARALESLGAVILVATRSLGEYERVLDRSDAVTVWGLGCHPAITDALAEYDAARFADLLTRASFVSEVGLDGSARTSMPLQMEVFDSILSQVAQNRRLISIHSRRATGQVLEAIERSGIELPILHWWLGSTAETQRATELGCLFSVNRSMDIRRLRHAGVELAQLLPETDHPSGNRGGNGPHQPGWTVDVEQLVSEAYGLPTEAVRLEFWSTFGRVADQCGVSGTLPTVVQAMIRQAST